MVAIIPGVVKPVFKWSSKNLLASGDKMNQINMGFNCLKSLFDYFKVKSQKLFSRNYSRDGTGSQGRVRHILFPCLQERLVLTTKT